MNSLGVNPYVNYLYTDLMDGLILFQIFEFIKPGIVNWKRVTRYVKKLKIQSYRPLWIRVTQVTKVFPKVTLKVRVFHPDFNDVHISSLR